MGAVAAADDIPTAGELDHRQRLLERGLVDVRDEVTRLATVTVTSDHITALRELVTEQRRADRERLDIVISDVRELKDMVRDHAEQHDRERRDQALARHDRETLTWQKLASVAAVAGVLVTLLITALTHGGG